MKLQLNDPHQKFNKNKKKTICTAKAHCKISDYKTRSKKKEVKYRTTYLVKYRAPGICLPFCQKKKREKCNFYILKHNA